MKDKDKKLSRRDFIRSAGVTGISSLFVLGSGLSRQAFAEEEKEKKEKKKEETGKMPMRKFGKTGVPVSILSLGGIIDFMTNQILLKKALDSGVTYWDTADCYNGGNSEEGIGKFFAKFPEARKKIFLVTKSDERDPKGMTRLLNRSFERMKTDYIDLYFIHGLRNVNELSDEMKAWVEKAKKENKIKFFGFSTHRDMADQMLGASKLGWIDGIMMKYNFRMMHEDKMKRAVEACHKAGIGLTAMKTQGGGPVKTDSDEEMKMAGKFLEKGYTPEQAKIKAVWGEEAIASICSQMPNLTILGANIAAAKDKKSLKTSDLNRLRIYAKNTCSGYCAGCAQKCEGVMGEDAYISDVMRYMMYHKNYGDAARARELFAAIPPEARKKMRRLNYAAAERVCPNNLPIGSIMREATDILT